jgi:hypothetical protein
VGANQLLAVKLSGALQRDPGQRYGPPRLLSEMRPGLRRLAATTVQTECSTRAWLNGEAIYSAILCTLTSTTVWLSQRLPSLRHS